MDNQLVEGFLFIHKPKGITSYDCIRHLQKIIKNKAIKIGHTGTLDPFATGMLIIALGKNATKHSEAFLTLDKEYSAVGKIGELTDTLDNTGIILEQHDISAITKQSLEQAIAALGTGYLQTPPAFAALKHQGEPLYKLVRSQLYTTQEIEAIMQTKRRKVTLYVLKLINFCAPFFTIKAHVSHGTYIRSLMNDIAQQCNSVATTYELERTKIGPFSLSQASALDALTTMQDIQEHLMPISTVLALLKKYHAS